jgi:hypothetical protein
MFENIGDFLTFFGFFWDKYIPKALEFTLVFLF